MQTFAKRIIPCLDVKDGRVVKGVNFVGLRDAGDPVEVARRYNDEGADELCFLDITATHEARSTIYDIVRSVAREVFIPLTVGGGVRTLDDISHLLDCGCDKVSLNSAAVRNPALVEQAATKFGSQCVVVAIDVKSVSRETMGGDSGEIGICGTLGDSYTVYLNGGRLDTGIDALGWAREVERLGAGEILLTSMDTDGTKGGFDLGITAEVARAVAIPVIASGGAGEMRHILDAFVAGADAALAASIFHYKEIEILELKRYLRKNGIAVRL